MVQDLGSDIVENYLPYFIIIMSNQLVDLYAALGVSPDCSPTELKKAHRKLALKYHPDKPGGDADLFELVTEAYNILSHPDSRAEYDGMVQQEVQANANINDQRQQFNHFKQSQPTQVTDHERMTFKQHMRRLDEKHGFMTDGGDLTRASADRKMRELLQTRQQFDELDMPEKLTQGPESNPAQFHAIFDQVHRGPTDIVVKDVPDAFNMHGQSSLTYSSLDTLEELYDDDPGNPAFDGQNYSSIFFDQSKGALPDANKLSQMSLDNNYYQNHNQLDADYNQQIKNKLNARDQQTHQLDNMSVNDFKTANTAGYGISEHVGIDLNNLPMFEDDSTNSRMNRLLKDRRQI